MGVPAFFRWLSRKYPSVIIECIEKKHEIEDGVFVHEDATLPNPNGVEFDNLYLDMNGIIHPCTHPEDKPAPKNEDEMMVAIFECIDRLFNIVRPRKLLYMAIDGVAPRAKMNQQRSRRFRASKEATEKSIEISRIRQELQDRGCILPPEKPKGEHFDSNCITPGTPFMDRLSKCLQFYIHDRLNNNPAWRNVKVILSDANVPGEGEHKIMDYIRKQRAQPDHDPNTQHVLCGADADLIMLGLATHEANFTIIREEFLPNKPRPCDVCNMLGHESKDCNGLAAVGGAEEPTLFGKETQFIFVRLSVLREYLERELEMPNLPFPYDFDRVLDDWVFMCFFVGNDFLPHLPSLEIREGAIDRLINLYKKCVYKTGGYLTDSGEVALDRVEMIMTDLGFMEDNIFKERQRSELRFRENLKRRKAQEKEKEQRPDFTALMNSQFAPTALGDTPVTLQNVRQEAANFRMIGMKNESTNRGNNSSGSQGGGVKRKAEDDEEADEDAHDEVRLWEAGFKERYYESKFDVQPDNIQFRNTVALEYVRGLCWVLKYYYQGCASWGWYFPYHYAPFASDFLNISGLSTKFDIGEPFKPLEQLMGVFPAASRSHVPKPFAELMIDPKSCIIDFYPEDFKIDLNGKKFAWQGVALLPFVDEKRLFEALKPVRDQLTDDEIKRNTTGEERLYLGMGCSFYEGICEKYKDKSNKINTFEILIDGMQGSALLSMENVCIGGTVHSPISGLPPIRNNMVVSVYYKNPKYEIGYIFPAKKLVGAIQPERVLKAKDNKDTNYRPNFGFNNQRSHSVQVAAGGHRMVNHYAANTNYYGTDNNWRQQQNRNTFNEVAPPNQSYSRDRGYGSNYNDRNNRRNQDFNSQSSNPYNNSLPTSGNAEWGLQARSGGYNQNGSNWRSGGRDSRFGTGFSNNGGRYGGATDTRYGGTESRYNAPASSNSDPRSKSRELWESMASGDLQRRSGTGSGLYGNRRY